MRYLHQGLASFPARLSKMLRLAATAMVLATILSCKKAPTGISKECTASSDQELPFPSLATTTAGAPLALTTPAATPEANFESCDIATAPDPFLEKVHDLVDGAAIIYEKFEQTPEAIIPELALLKKSEWMDLGRRNPDLSNSEAVQRALSEARVEAKSRMLSQIQWAIEKFHNKNPGHQLHHVEQLAPYLKNPQSAHFLSRYTTPPKENWRDILKQFRSEIANGTADFVVVEKKLPAGAIESPGILFTRQNEIHYSPGDGSISGKINHPKKP